MDENLNNSLLFKGVENRAEHFRKIGYSAFYFAATFILLSYTSHARSTSNAWDVGFPLSSVMTEWRVLPVLVAGP